MNPNMSFDHNNPEEELLNILSPYIRKMSRNRWQNLEPEDRLSEAFYITSQAIRCFPVNSGHFLKDLKKALYAHMDELNRSAPSRFYSRDYSLDRQIPANDHNSFWTLYDVIADISQSDESSIVEMFIDSLPEAEAAIMSDLFSNELSRAVTARKYGLSIYKLNQCTKRIWEKYQSGT